MTQIKRAYVAVGTVFAWTSEPSITREISMWNYRVIRRVWGTGDKREELLGIHEVYYDERGRIWAISTDPVEPLGEDMAELDDELARMSEAMKKPTLDYDTCVDGSVKSELTKDMTKTLSDLGLSSSARPEKKSKGKEIDDAS